MKTKELGEMQSILSYHSRHWMVIFDDHF